MNIVDTLFYVHPDLSEDQCASLEDTLSSSNGVMHVHFDKKVKHEVNVSYNPDAITADALRKQIRDWDKDVKIIGL